MIGPFTYLLFSDDENGNLITKICNGYGNLNFRLPENEIYNTITNTYLEFYSDDQVQGHGFRVHIRQGNLCICKMTQSL